MTFELNTNEKYALIGALCDKLRWLYGVGGTRDEHLEVAQRLVELCRALPSETDAA